MYLRALLLAVAVTFTACAVSPPVAPADSCGERLLQTAKSARELRAVATACPNDTAAQAKALLRLNSLPPTPAREVALAPLAAGSLERVTWEVDLYFYPLESYPPEDALAKLEDLVSRTASVQKLEVLRIVGGGEAGEGAEVASARAAFVREYFLKAHLPPSTQVQVGASSLLSAQSDEGRARARKVAVQLVAVRQQRQQR